MGIDLTYKQVNPVATKYSLDTVREDIWEE